MNNSLISWSESLKQKFKSNIYSTFNNKNIINTIYRPFFKQFLYFDKIWIHRTREQSKVFGHEDENLAIVITGQGEAKDFSCLVVNTFTDGHLLAGSHCLPLFYYRPSSLPSMPAEKISAINQSFITALRKQYGDVKITDKMVFYYVYAMLHHPVYRTKFSSDLKKLFPHIPIVTTFSDFTIYYEAGAKLANLHVYYESAKLADLPIAITSPNYAVQKMRFAKARDVDGKFIDDKSTIIYNPFITISSIPLEAYNYIVNGKSAIEWIMERYAITTDKKSGLTNDPNLYCTEIGNEKYIFNLLLRVITVSVETVKIVNELPKWEE